MDNIIENTGASQQIQEQPCRCRSLTVGTVFKNHNLTVIGTLKEKMKETGRNLWDVYSFVTYLKNTTDGFISKKEATIDMLVKKTGATIAQVRRYRSEAIELGLIKRAMNGGLILVSYKTNKNSEKLVVDIKDKKTITQIETAIQGSLLKVKAKAQAKAKKRYKRSTYICNSVPDTLIMSNEKGGDILGMSGTWFSENKRKFISEGISFKRNKQCLGKKSRQEVESMNEKLKQGFVFISRMDGNAYLELPSFISITETKAESKLNHKSLVIAEILSRRSTERKIAVK